MFRKTEYTHIEIEHDYEKLSFKDNFDRNAYETKYGIKTDRVPYVLIIAIIAVFVLFAFWGIGSFQYIYMLLPNTIINDIDVSDMMCFEASDMLRSSYKNTYSIPLVYEDNVINLTTDDLNLSFSFTDSVDEVVSSQNAWSWPFVFDNEYVYNIEPEILYDESDIREGVLTAVLGTDLLPYVNDITDLVCVALQNNLSSVDLNDFVEG